MQHVLRNKDGKPIGYLRETGNLTRLLNADGKVQGYYNKSTNVTHDPAGNVVARSNILVTLLKN